MSVIGLGKCSRFYLYILGSVSFKFLESIILGYNSKGETKFYSIYGFIPLLKDSNYMESIYGYVGYIIFGILFELISKNKKKEKSRSSKNLVPKTIIHNKQNKKTKKTYIKIILFCFLLIFHIEVKKILYNSGYQAFNIWSFDIIFMLLFMNKYFIIYYYKHRVYSLIFIIVTTATLIVMSSFLPYDNKYLNLYEEVERKTGSYLYSFLFILFFILLSCIYSFSRVLGKVLMQIKFVSPYYLIIFLGIMGLILTFIISLITNFFNYDDTIFGYFEKLKQKLNDNNKYEFYFEIFVISPLFAFISFMEITFEILTVYYLNPLYILITNNLCYGVIQLITFIVEYKDNYGVSIILHFLCEEFSEVFALLGYSVYLEIIELRFCGLTNDLRRRISIRAESELQDSLDPKNTTVEEENESEGDDEEKEEENEKEENEKEENEKDEN